VIVHEPLPAGAGSGSLFSRPAVLCSRQALPAQPPQPAGPVEVAELDELYTFIGDKKTSPTS
jgi:hypothetical protein